MGRRRQLLLRPAARAGPGRPPRRVADTRRRHAPALRRDDLPGPRASALSLGGAAQPAAERDTSGRLADRQAGAAASEARRPPQLRHVPQRAAESRGGHGGRGAAARRPVQRRRATHPVAARLGPAVGRDPHPGGRRAGGRSAGRAGAAGARLPHRGGRAGPAAVRRAHLRDVPALAARRVAGGDSRRAGSDAASRRVGGGCGPDQCPYGGETACGRRSDIRPRGIRRCRSGRRRSRRRAGSRTAGRGADRRRTIRSGGCGAPGGGQSSRFDVRHGGCRAARSGVGIGEAWAGVGWGSDRGVLGFCPRTFVVTIAESGRGGRIRPVRTLAIGAGEVVPRRHGPDPTPPDPRPRRSCTRSARS